MKASRSIKRGLAVVSSLGLAFALSGCEDESNAAAADGSGSGPGGGGGGGEPKAAAAAPTPVAALATPAVVADAGGMSVVTGAGRSKHFDAVASRLHVGGAVFAYVDVDGDVEKIADLLQEVLDKLPPDQMPPHIQQLDLAKVLSELGLDGVEALGMSSYKNGDLFHNRAFVYVPQGRKGLLKVFGGESGPLLSMTLAPADADLVIEQTINIRAGYDIVSAMVMRFGGPEASKEFQREMGQVNPELGLSMAEIFGRVDTRLTLVGRVHPDKPMEIPDAPIEIPSVDFLIALDDLGWLYEKITTKIKAELPEEMLVKGDGFEMIVFPQISDQISIAPVIYHDLASKRVLFASSQAFIDECHSGKTKLADSADFKAATAGLPTEGNGLSYMSPKLMKTGRALYGELVESAEGGIGRQETLVLSMLAAIFPGTDAGQAKVIVNQKDGIFISSNSTASIKEGLIMGGAGIMAALTGFSYRVMGSSRAFEDHQNIQFGEGVIGREAIEKVPEPVPVPVPPLREVPVPE